MADFEVKFDGESARRRMRLLEKGLVDSVRGTLNVKAMSAGNMQRKVVPGVFTVRNKWVTNSLWPKMGKRKGLVPQRMRSISRMYSTAGSISPLLEKQEKGFSKNDPSIPTDKARVGQSHKRIVRKKLRVDNISATPTLIPDKSMKRVKDSRERASALIAMAQELNWKGLLLIENDEVLPAGYWSLRGTKLNLLRRNQEGRKRRQPITWHEDSIRLSQLSTNDQAIFNKEAGRNISRF